MCVRVCLSFLDSWLQTSMGIVDSKRFSGLYLVRPIEVQYIVNVFLAPTGAQGVTMGVRPFVRSFGSSLSKALILAQIYK